MSNDAAQVSAAAPQADPPNRRRFGLSARIAVLLAIMCIPIIGGIVYISVSTLKSTVNNDYEQRATLIAQFFSADIINEPDKISYDHFQGEIEKLHELNRDIMKISVYAPRGDQVVRIASTDPSQIGEVAQPEDRAPLDTNQATLAESNKNGRRIIEAIAPLTIDGKPAATIGIYMYLDSRDSLIHSQQLKFLLIGGFGIAALLALLYLSLHLYLIKPVARLARVTRAVSRGDFSQKVDFRSKNELGDLGNSVNTMTESLSVQSAELKNKVSELEQVNTDLKDSERELRLTNKQLETANRLKSQFLATMSHELRTPLNSIIGFSELLEDETYGGLNNKQMRYVGNIVVSSKHLLKLINDILDLAKVESGTIEIHPEQLSLPDAMSSVISIVEPLATKKDINLETNIIDDVKYIHADPARFKQILYNLLSNAIKFTPSGGKVHVEAQRSHDEVEISVTDTGIGISRRDQQRIFSEFLQVEGTYARKYEGTGLGLALTKKLVELHGGRIRVRSAPGLGSRFSFVIPDVAPGEEGN
ncbi:MAG: ATP-binding protein [Actinomycetota bacterium]|nr:ATP-binding protein [Actinomycetota bacterium]MDA8167291.1 ATP-binding protein [Actinomycetota bacterium]